MTNTGESDGEHPIVDFWMEEARRDRAGDARVRKVELEAELAHSKAHVKTLETEVRKLTEQLADIRRRRIELEDETQWWKGES